MMTDLSDVLREAAAPGHRTPPAFLVAADLERGRRGLRRSRTVVGVRSGVVAAAAAGLVAVALQTSVVLEAAAPPPPVVAQATPEVPAAPQTSVALVAYTDTQPVGFLIDRVPAGWEVQSSDEGVLLLAPIGFPDQDPNWFVGKIAIMLGPVQPEGVNAREIQVGDTTGQVAYQTDEQDAPTHPVLIVPQGPDTQMLIQVPVELGWSEQEMADFGAGIHVTPDAVAGVG